MTGDNLLGVPETRLPANPMMWDALAAASGSVDELRSVVAANPTSSLGWALLADATFDARAPLESYAYARVGYHRGLDALRKAGWRGQGPVPWAHEPNRGVLRAVYALRRAAAVIGEEGEVIRLDALLRDCDPDAATRIEAESTATQLLPVVSAAEAGAVADAEAADRDADPSPPTEAFFIRGED